MLTIDPAHATLVMIDFQARLMPAIDDGAEVLANAVRLRDAAKLLGIPMLTTEQNPRGLGPTVDTLTPDPARCLAKMEFDACRAEGFLQRLPPGHALVVAGCEAHVCVQQTVLGLLSRGRRVHVVRDAIGSRRAESKETGVARMARLGADIVTAEMVLFEWLGSYSHPRFREVVALVK